MIHDQKSQNIHANWPPFISRCIAIYIYMYIWVCVCVCVCGRLPSSDQFYWTRQDTNTCPKLDTCSHLNVSSETGHQTQVQPYIYYIKATIPRKIFKNILMLIWSNDSDCHWTLIYVIIFGMEWDGGEKKVRERVLTYAGSKAKTISLFHVGTFLFHPIK